MQNLIKKNHILLVLLMLLFSLTSIVLISQTKSNPKYKTAPIEEEYAPDFQLKENLTYYSVISKNDENILLFWSRLCPHCEDVINYIKSDKIYSKVKKYLFTVSTDDSIDAVKEHSKDFSIYLDYNYKIFESFRCEHTPTVFIINSNGKILAKSEGGKASITLLNEFIDHNN